MARVYDNWERLVTATLRREQLRLSGLRTPSDLSSASFSSFSGRVSSFNFSTSLVGESFTYQQILQATDYLSKSNLIKRGHSGDIFSGVLEDGIQVVVKKIDLSLSKQESLFLSEVEIFGKISHSRLVPLLGHCLENIKENFLVYKYMPNKDVSSSLFIKEVPEHNYDLISLDWITRLKIAIGAAEGLCYLHDDCIPPLVHRDIQASSILLDDKFEVRLGSLSEVCIAEENVASKQNRIAKFLRLPKGPGQGKSGTSMTATCAYDVYCFGKVLLELVTGNLGISAAKEDAMDMGNVLLLKDWIAKALSYITIDDMDILATIVDQSLIIDVDLLMEVWAVAIVAKACLNPKPWMRPKMAHILKALENPLMVVTAEEPESARFTRSLASQSADSPHSVGPTPAKSVPAGTYIGY